MPFDMKPVTNTESGHIAAAGYDPMEQVVRIEYKGGRTYDYHGVSADVWKAFNEAPKAGTYLAQVIKPACPVHEVKENE